MPINTVADCPRCGREDKILGTVNEATLEAKGWKTVLNTLLCPDCVKTIEDTVQRKAAPKADAGFVDGRPAKRGV